MQQLCGPTDVPCSELREKCNTYEGSELECQLVVILWDKEVCLGCIGADGI